MGEFKAKQNAGVYQKMSGWVRIGEDARICDDNVSKTDRFFCTAALHD